MNAASLLELRPERAGSSALLAADAPWRMRDLTRTARTVLAGAVGLTAGWIGASGTALISRQLIWAAVSVGGVILAGTGMVSWLLAGLRVVQQVAQEALLPLRAELDSPSGVTSVASATPAIGTLVTASGMTRFHDPGCLLMRNKQHQIVLATNDLRPCGVCQP